MRKEHFHPYEVVRILLQTCGSNPCRLPARIMCKCVKSFDNLCIILIYMSPRRWFDYFSRHTKNLCLILEITGLEPILYACKAHILPLNYIPRIAIFFNMTGEGIEPPELEYEYSILPLNYPVFWTEFQPITLQYLTCIETI